MSHLTVGFIIGGALLLVVIVLALAWRLLAFILDPVSAATAIGVITIVTIGVIIIDWYTERRTP